MFPLTRLQVILVEFLLSNARPRAHSLQNSNKYSDCPGTQSNDAGKVAACAGCPNQVVCASGLPRAPDPGQLVVR